MKIILGEDESSGFLCLSQLLCDGKMTVLALQDQDCGFAKRESRCFPVSLAAQSPDICKSQPCDGGNSGTAGAAYTQRTS